MRCSVVTKIVTLILMPVMICGCSTMFGRQNDDQNVSFDSNVQGAEINCSGKRVDAPGSLPLKQSKNHACIAEAPGYEKKVFDIKSGMSWSGFGNSTAINTALWGWWTLGIGTVVGWLIDGCSGAMRNLKEENIYVKLKPIGTVSTSEKVFDKTVEVGKAVIELPVQVVQNTASTVLDTTVRGGAAQVGIVGEEKAKPASQASGKPKSTKII